MSRSKYLSISIMVVVICALFCGLTPIVRAQGGSDIYVDASNTGYFDGNMANPYPTIWQAMNIAPAGCTIHVAPGDYHEFVYFGDSISLIGSDPNRIEDTVIHGPVTFDWVDGCMLDGFTITGSETSGVHCSYSSPIIKRCIIRQNRHHGIGIWYGSPLIKSCVIWNNGHSGVRCDWGGNPVVLNSIICANHECGVHDTEARFCVIQDLKQIDPVDGYGLINEDPLFVNADPANAPPYDFHLRNIADGYPHDSVAIDMGTSDGLIRDWDTDIGVYQGYVRIEPIVIPRRKALVPGDSFQFTALGGAPPYVWGSTDPNIAIIDPNDPTPFNFRIGIIAKAPGYVKITVTDPNSVIWGLPAHVVVNSPGDAALLREDPNSGDLNTAYTYYQDSNDHLGIALAGIAKCVDQPDPNVRAYLTGLDVGYNGIFNLEDPNLTYGPHDVYEVDANAQGLDMLQDVLQGSILPSIETAIGHLDMITDPEYRRYIGVEDDLIFEDEDILDNIFEVDIGDIYLLKAGLHAVHAVIDIVTSYTLWDPNLEYCDLDDPFVDPNTVNDFLDTHPDILTLLQDGLGHEVGGDRMANAFDHIQSAAFLIKDGFDIILSEEDNQYDDLLVLKGEMDDPNGVWEAFDQCDPNTGQCVFYMDYVNDTQCSPLNVDFSRLFLDPLDRNDLPGFDSENDAILDTIPDPTFHGALPDMTLARLNGFILDELDAWGWQVQYTEYTPAYCENIIEWHIWTQDLGDFVDLTIYRDTQPCVDPNTATPLITIDPNNMGDYMWYLMPFDPNMGSFELQGNYFDSPINCYQEGVYYYLVEANYKNPLVKMTSDIIRIQNTLYYCNGDVNLNGGITPKDALCAFEKYLGICPTSCGMACMDVCCDVSQDGDCTPSDALCIFKKYLGLPNCLGWY